MMKLWIYHKRHFPCDRCCSILVHVTLRLDIQNLLRSTKSEMRLNKTYKNTI